MTPLAFERFDLVAARCELDCAHRAFRARLVDFSRRFVDIACSPLRQPMDTPSRRRILNAIAALAVVPIGGEDKHGVYAVRIFKKRTPNASLRASASKR
jgi:hypothetical protein